MLYNKISLVINGLHSRFLTDIESPLDSRYNKVSLRIQHKLVPETNLAISSIFEFQRKEAKFELNFFCLLCKNQPLTRFIPINTEPNDFRRLKN